MTKNQKRRALTPEGRKRQLRVLKHNGMRGHVAMMKSQLNAMLSSDSITPEAFEIASSMHRMASDLDEHLKTRVDPPT